VGGSDAALGKVINCGRCSGVSIGELAEMILQICQSDAKIVAMDERKRPENSEVLELVCDNTQARELLGWSPAYSLKEGLELTVAWMQKNLKHYKSNLYNV